VDGRTFMWAIVLAYLVFVFVKGVLKVRLDDIEGDSAVRSYNKEELKVLKEKRSQSAKQQSAPQEDEDKKE